MNQRQPRTPTPDEKLATRLLKAIQMMMSTSQEGERNVVAGSFVSMCRNNGIEHGDIKLFVVKDANDFLASKLQELDEANQDLDDALSREEEMFEQIASLTKQLGKKNTGASKEALDNMKAELQDALKKIVNYETDQESLINERDELKASLASSEADLVAVMKKLTAAQHKIDTLNAKLKTVVIEKVNTVTVPKPIVEATPTPFSMKRYRKKK